MIRCPHKLNLRLSDKDQAWLMELLGIFRKQHGQQRTKTDMVLRALQDFRDTLFTRERRFLDPPALQAGKPTVNRLNVGLAGAADEGKAREDASKKMKAASAKSKRQRERRAAKRAAKVNSLPSVNGK